MLGTNLWCAVQVFKKICESNLVDAVSEWLNEGRICFRCQALVRHCSPMNLPTFCFWRELGQRNSVTLQPFAGEGVSRAKLCCTEHTKKRQGLLNSTLWKGSGFGAIQPLLNIPSLPKLPSSVSTVMPRPGQALLLGLQLFFMNALEVWCFAHVSPLEVISDLFFGVLTGVWTQNIKDTRGHRGKHGQMVLEVMDRFPART